jgi:hypothetical protein
MNPKSYLMRFRKKISERKKTQSTKENNGTVHSMVHNEGVYSEI